MNSRIGDNKNNLINDAKESIDAFINNRKILILGFGKEGRSTYRMLRAYFPKLELCISDRNTAIADEKALQDDPYLSWVLGDGHMKVLPLYELVFKSPGISFKDYQPPAGQQISSQTDLFIKLFRDRIIGVTGTKGKSTTVSLLYHILNEARKDVLLVGNIGKPAFDSISDIKEDTLIVYELSSHQLEFVTHSPHIAIFLNIYEEHLDHYVSFLDYQQAKQHITDYQQEGDFLIYNADNILVSKRVEESRTLATRLPFGMEVCDECNYIAEGKIHFSGGRELALDSTRIPLPGRHNLLNITASLLAVSALKMDISQALESLYTFKALPHRLEEVARCKGIRFINDSIATIPEATIRAMETFDELDMLILGGYNRGIDYSSLIDYLLERNIAHLILIGEVGLMLKELLEDEGYKLPMHMAKSMDEVVRLAFELGKEGSLCLLSPAASSYDSFRNFEDRGDQFKKKVLELC